METTVLTQLRTVLETMSTSLSTGAIDDIREQHLEQLAEALEAYLTTSGDSIHETARIRMEQATTDLEERAEEANITGMLRAIDTLKTELEHPAVNT